MPVSNLVLHADGLAIFMREQRDAWLDGVALWFQVDRVDAAFAQQ